MRSTVIILLVLILCQAALAERNPAPAASENAIAAVAFSPDGSKLAAGGYQVVTIFDSATGRELARLPGHPGMVTSVAFSPDGKTLAAAGGLPGRSGEVRLWDVSWVKTVGLYAVKVAPMILDGPSDVVYSVAFSPNGRMLAAGSYDHDVTVWALPLPGARAKIRKLSPRTLRDHTNAVYGVAFSPDSSMLASAAGDRTVKVWDPATGQRLYTLSESTSEVFAVAFRPSGTQIAAGGADKTLRTWNVTRAGGKLAKSAFAHQGSVLRVAYAHDGRTLLTSGEDDLIKRWDAATLTEKQVYPKSPDWPQGIALSTNDRLVAVGCHNGMLANYDAQTGRLARTFLKGVPVAAKPTGMIPASSQIPGRQLGNQRQRRAPGTGGATLFQAVLNEVSPRGARRGGTVRFTMTGARISDALGVYFDDPAIEGRIVTPSDTSPGVLKVDVALSAATRIGTHRVFVQTPLGSTGAVPFAVGDWPEIQEAEPNNTVSSAQRISTPCTVVGALDTPGDVDYYRVEAHAGEELVFDVVSQAIRSRLQPVLTLYGGNGSIVAKSKPQIGRPDALLGFRCPVTEAYTVRISDFEGAGGGDLFYRLNVGEFPVVTDIFPLVGQAGTTLGVEVTGFNLDGARTARVTLPPDGGWGHTAPVEMQTSKGALLATRSTQVWRDPIVAAAGRNLAVEKPQDVSVPCVVNGRLAKPSPPGPLSQTTGEGEHGTLAAPNRPTTRRPNDPSVRHYYRFAAKKGQTLLVDVVARRIGSPLDSEIEILDSRGKPVERAVMRPVFQTEVTLADRDSASSGIRIVAWDGVGIGDYMMIGREVIKVVEMPRGPDSDIFYRSFRGQRLGYFGTTPEFHSIGAPVYKVEPNPPGTTFSPNGFPLIPIYYRNDDGGPLFGKDSHLEFTPPADGEYIVRVTDARGQDGPDYAYGLLIHPPRADFKLIVSPANPNIPAGGGAVVNVEVERYDGFEEPIELKVENLPPGIAATTSTIEAGETSAQILLTDDGRRREGWIRESVQLRIVGRAVADGRELVRTTEPENGVRLVTVLPGPDLLVSSDRKEIMIRPGAETEFKVDVDRQGKFGARVPIDVKNLPFGVRVANVGLNGVLVTEKDTSRIVTLVCDPWVKPQTRIMFVAADVEGGTPNAGAPMKLRIEPVPVRATLRRAAHAGRESARR